MPLTATACKNAKPREDGKPLRLADGEGTITDPSKIAELLRAIDGYSGTLATQCALRLAPLVFVRPSELRQAEWSEIDLDNALWVIPAARMKMREKHVVPLSHQPAH